MSEEADEDWFERGLREATERDDGEEEDAGPFDEEAAVADDTGDTGDDGAGHPDAERDATAEESAEGAEGPDPLEDVEPADPDGFDDVDDIDDGLSAETADETSDTLRDDSGSDTDDPFGGVHESPDDANGPSESDADGEWADIADDEVLEGDFDGGGFGGLDGNGGVDTADASTPTTDDAGDDPFGGARTGADDDPFGDDFAAAMQDAPGEFGDGDGGEFGGDAFGGFGGGGAGPDFDEEEFESDIDRIDVGIEGLDEMILGGIPERSLMAVIGSAGTGKTTFGLQFLNETLENGGNAVYITLEETEEAILSTAEEKGWEYRRYADEDRLAVIAMDPIEMANSLDSIRDDISRLVTEFGADRLVLDSVSLLEMMYDHPSKRRSEVFDFARSLKEAGVTTMLTSEASEDNAYASRHGIVEYLTDAVFILQYVRPSDFRETRLAVEIQKIRDANHSRETKPYEITNDGISVYRQANIF
ncbi:KaiC domain-containing protein [Halobaculum limi]|uniref:KaiC domain-containing protein n=1 Tax=Halobaculum limi TaxID=3031916 RepID=UPI00240535F3|nr:KaiC domain-containing protein [Halobaculum sp. YSMS11]